MPSEHDLPEFQPHDARITSMLIRVAELIRHARKDSAFWGEHLPKIQDGPLSEQALATLPVLRKSQLPSLQQALLPFGGLGRLDPGDFPWLFLSPGPIHEPGPRNLQDWNAVQALRAAGLQPGDVVLNTFGYHLTPAGIMMDASARDLGCAVIPAGSGNTEQIIQAMTAYRPVSYIGTADYLNILLNASDFPLTLKNAVVSGAAVPDSLRATFGKCGIEVFECYGTAELGIIAYETSSHDGLLVCDNLLIEIVAPGTGDPLPDGEIGELVVTPLRADYPLFRFATGDLSAILPGPSGCGRTNRRLRGWLGRADDAVKVKGMFLRPDHHAQLLSSAVGLLSYARFIIDRSDERDRLTLEAEGPSHDDGASDRVITIVRNITRLGCALHWQPDGTIPRGKPIADWRGSNNDD